MVLKRLTKITCKCNPEVRMNPPTQSPIGFSVLDPETLKRLTPPSLRRGG